MTRPATARPQHRLRGAGWRLACAGSAGLAACATLALLPHGAWADGPAPALAQSPRVPTAIIDLRTDAGAALANATWTFADVDITPATNAAPPPAAEGASRRDTHTIFPAGADAEEIDRRAMPVAASSLEQRCTPGRLAFGWYTLRFVVPQSVSEQPAAGATLVFECVVDDYAEVLVDGRSSPVLGSSRGPFAAGWNAPTRVLLTRDAQPGDTFTIRIFASNAPLSNPPANYCWVRSATLQLYAGEREQDATPVPTTITRVHPALDDVLPQGATIEHLASGFQFGEGPVWVPAKDDPVAYGGGGAGGYLLFSDPNQNVIHRFDPHADVQGVVTVYRTTSGYAGADIGRYRQPGSNGLALDATGRLTICEHGNRRVTRLEPNGTLTVLASAYEGKRLNSPNDLVYRSDGTLYFTDPPFGLPMVFDDPAKELPFSGVYALAKDGTLRLAARDLAAPNGLAFSPDERFLYVGNWEVSRKVILRYDVAPDGALSNPVTFFDMTSTPGDICLDGLKVDPRGNVFASGPGGVWIIAPDGTHLGTLAGPELAANFAFGDADGKTLYLTARTGLYRVRVK